MVLSNKLVTFLILVFFAPIVFANTHFKIDEKYLNISRAVVSEVIQDSFGVEKNNPISSKYLNQDLLNSYEGYQERSDLDDPGKVIAVARDLVALGEDVYRLVTKGRPNNVTNYQPISVIPKENGVPVDLLDTENWSAPAKRTYELYYENGYGMKVVHFRYSVIYSYRGSYDNKGAYLTSVQIVPEFVRTLFGFDFTATMKLGGIQNQGLKSSPVAGATILLEYTVSSIVTAIHNVDSFFITGRGSFKKL